MDRMGVFLHTRHRIGSVDRRLFDFEGCDDSVFIGVAPSDE